MCADESDNATALEQHYLDVALQNRPRPSMPFTGKCHYCEEQIDAGHFCDAFCKTDYERHLRAQQHGRAK